MDGIMGYLGGGGGDLFFQIVSQVPCADLSNEKNAVGYESMHESQVHQAK